MILYGAIPWMITSDQTRKLIIFEKEAISQIVELAVAQPELKLSDAAKLFLMVK
jgi:hypothetical protein